MIFRRIRSGSDADWAGKVQITRGGELPQGATMFAGSPVAGDQALDPATADALVCAMYLEKYGKFNGKSPGILNELLERRAA